MSMSAAHTVGRVADDKAQAIIIETALDVFKNLASFMAISAFIGSILIWAGSVA